MGHQNIADLDGFYLVLILASYASDEPLKCQITLIGPPDIGYIKRFEVD
jgi:hypothetical protein